MNRAIAMIAAGLLACACACAGKGGATVGGGGGGGGGGGSGAGAGDGDAARLCDGIRPKVEQLYRAEAQAKEPKRVDEAVSDNTTMVMNDCARAPRKVAKCVDGVASVPELEKKCLAPLDDEGTEGEALRR
jgi:hypothetical protein